MVNTGGSEVGMSRVTEDVVKVIAQVPPVIDRNPAPESPQVKP